MLSLIATAAALAVPFGALAQQGPPDGLAVRILNTPIPVTGSTTVSGTVGATQSGTWNVNATVQGTPSVAISNTAASPGLVIDVSKAASNLVELSCQATAAHTSPPCVAITPGAANGGAFTVPDGRQLVVTTITALHGGADTTGVTGVRLGQAPASVISAGTFFIRDFFPLPNTEVMTHLLFNSGIVIASGHQLVIEVSPGANNVNMTIRGYVTPL